LLPIPLFDAFNLDLLFSEAQPDFAAERRKRDVKQASHKGFRY
jgi:hypothetical protein